MTQTTDTTSEPLDPSIRYSDAMEELEGLLDEIESDDVDLDDLAVKVERASKLIELCRSKIERTEMQVKSIIDDLDGADEGDEA